MLIIKSAAKKPFITLRKQVISAAAVALLAMTPQVHAGVDGPIWGNPTLLGTTSFKLSDVGYQQSEYFISGNAKSYINTTPLSSDGKWSVIPLDQAASPRYRK